MNDTIRPAEPLHAVINADHAIWEAGDTHTIQRRNDAASAALAAGWTPDEIAAQLNVRADDVQRWAAPAPTA
jgi:hypothetical protein